jgi:WD40 repeat protein/serine/threonine protein kinase
MAAPATADDFLRLTRQSGLVEEARLKACLDRLGDAGRGPADGLAEQLCREGLLTSFQVKHLLQGRHKGFLLGEYRILEPLGAGGMGVVYLCEHAVMKRRVAVKVLPSATVDDPATRERFYREARAVAALDHPNIVRAYTIEEYKKVHFLVMEYIDGVALHHLVEKEGPLDAAVAAGYAVQAARGLEHIHDKGLVHRDIKPANLLLDRKGVVKILDLGLARFSRHGKDDLTRRLDGNVVLGTADYLAPEQALDSHKADGRADLYSLGATLYFLLTGSPPFSGTTTQKLVRAQMGAPRLVHEVQPTVGAALGAVVDRMMARKVHERYQRAAEVVAALEPFANDAHASGSSVRLGASARGAVGGPPLQTPPADPPPEPVRRDAVRPAASTVRRSRGRTTPLRSRSVLEKPENLPDLPDFKRRFVLSSGLLYATGVLAVFLAGGPLVLVWLVFSSSPTSTRSEPPAAAAVEPEGGVGGDAPHGRPVVGPIAFAPAPAPVQGREARRFLGHADGVERLAISPDGLRVLSTSADHTIRLWDLRTGQTVAILHGHTKACHGVAISPDGRLALTGGADHTVRLWDLQTGEQRKVFAKHGDVVWCVVFSPDGRQFASGGADLTVRLWDVESGAEVKRFVGHSGAVMSVAISPDGRRLLSGAHDGTVRLWDVQTGGPIRTYTGHAKAVIAVAFVGPGARLLSGSHDSTLRLWETETGRCVRIFEGHNGTVVGLAPSPEGKRILSGGSAGELFLWDLESGAMLDTIGRHDSKITCVAWTPEGSHALTSSSDKSIRVWRLPAATLGTSAGMLGHWTFDERAGARAADSSGQGNHGQLVGRPTWTEGKRGGGLRLGGNGDHVMTSFTRQLDVWTVALWVRGDRSPGAGSPSGPVHREKNLQINWDHANPENRGAANLCVKGRWHAASFGPLQGGRWYHLAAVFDGEKLRTFADGVLVNTTDVYGAADQEDAALVFGKHATRVGYFSGVIDDVRLYGRPLSDQDVADLFAGR